MKTLTILDFGAEGTIPQGVEVAVGAQRNVSARVITQADVDHFVAHGALPRPKVPKAAAGKPAKTTSTGANK